MRENLNNEIYMYDDIDITKVIKDKAIHVAYDISNHIGISFEEAFKQYINSDAFKQLEDISTGLWAQSYNAIINHYYEQEENVKRRG